VVTSTSKALSIANKGLTYKLYKFISPNRKFRIKYFKFQCCFIASWSAPYEYDQYGNKISNLGGNKINFYHQSDGNLKIEDAESGATNLIQNGSNYIKDYKQKNVSWTSVTLEFYLVPVMKKVVF
jgi:exopolysaccharide biosynthesis protein